ncbi:hypothetical protein [Streptomyces sp. CB01881]|uniref:hypothetical protein n=1 Tax=Streptomyces sp. CB01881 TaxID=2078691 RepID=UPI0011DF8B52|nr:hypothetical protein [Streptomyces sp. CB01881]TYC70470.1 hypothetical protein EH183_31935 [Streptomyces sp. CB01881]
MTIPGFTAESALHHTGGHYRVSRHGSARGPQVIEGQWSFCAVECRAECLGPCRNNPNGRECRQCRKDCLDTCDTSRFQ